MGVAAAKAPVAKAPVAKAAAAPPQRAAAPVPKIHVRSPTHTVHRACDCGSAAGFSGRCEACDRTSLATSRTTEADHVRARAPGPDPSSLHMDSTARGHDLARLNIRASAVAASAPRQATTPTAAPTARLLPIRIQTQLRVSSPGDAAEQEAQEVGRRIAGMPEPTSPAPIRRAQAGAVQRRAIAPTMAGPDVVAGLHGSRSSGAPLPRSVRSFMEPRFGADFGAVRVHTDAQAASLSNQLSAHAFTIGHDVYFNKGQFQPETTEGRELIAHELAHTIQQGGVIQRSAENAPVAERAPESIQRGFLSSIVDAVTDPLAFIADKANMIPGFRMLTIILGVNPINMSKVDASPANILMALIEFIPGGGIVTQALQNSGVFDKVGNWIADQIKGLVATGASLKTALSTFISSLSLADLGNLSGAWDRAKRIFTEPIDRLIAFAKGVVTGILKFIKDAILLPLAKLAQGTPSWDLLTAVLGKNPITDEKVEPKPDVLIGGFMKLIGQSDVWENMQKSNAVSRAWAWFQNAKSAVVAFVSQIPGAFLALFNSLTIQDVVLVVGAFEKVRSIFGGFVGNFISWAGNAVWNLLEIIFDVVSPGAFSYVKKTGAALKDILKNPLPFVGNLVKAAKLGFENFAGNIGTHLKEGLIDWLTGSLPGVYIPKAMSLAELGKFALSVLGITWDQIRAKIVKALGPKGETIMKGLEHAFDVVKALVTGGVSAAWALIMEKLTGLKDMVIDGIIGFVTDSIIKKAVPKLIAMFIPGAGFISAIISIYDTIKVFIEKLAKIAAVIKSFVDSIVAIAAGEIGGAANRVEGALTGLLSLAISFFAGFVGLGNVASKVMEVIKKVQTAVDKALDTAITWLITKAKALFASLFGGKDKDGNDKKNANDLSETKPVAMAGASHTLKVKDEGGSLSVWLASTEQQLESRIAQIDRILTRWEDYINSIVNPEVKDEFEILVKPDITAKKAAILSSTVARIKGMKSLDKEKARAAMDAAVITLSGEISSWATSAKLPVQDFSDKAVSAALGLKAEEAAEKAWRDCVQETQTKMDGHAAKIQALDGSARLKYRGSLAKFRRGIGKNFGQFDPFDYDIDFFVQSDKLYIEVVGEGVEGPGEVWADEHPKLRAMMAEMAAAYDSIKGVRKGKFSMKLRSVSNVLGKLAKKGTRENAGERHIEVKPPPPPPASVPKP
jgi:hypothetical protein